MLVLVHLLLFLMLLSTINVVSLALLLILLLATPRDPRILRLHLDPASTPIIKRERELLLLLLLSSLLLSILVLLSRLEVLLAIKTQRLDLVPQASENGAPRSTVLDARAEPIREVRPGARPGPSSSGVGEGQKTG